MATKKFIIIAGQDNALEGGDAASWEALHPYVSLRSLANNSSQTKQWTGGAYSDTVTLPNTFFGGPQLNYDGTETFGSWQNVSVMGRAMQAVRFLTPYNPAASNTNLGTSTTTNYPGTCEVMTSPTPTGTVFATTTRWQGDPVSLTLTRRSTGTVHTIAAGWTVATNTVTVTPACVPPPQVGEQFTYEFQVGATLTADSQLSLCNVFGGLQDVGSALDTAALTGAVTTGNHPVMISRMRTAAPATDTAMRVTLRTRPAPVGSVISFAESASLSIYTNAGGASMSGTTITAVSSVPWVVGQPIQFFAGDGTLPVDIVTGTRYWVLSVSGAVITVSEDQGGSAHPVGASFAAGATGPYATAASVPDALTPGTQYYVTRKAIDDDDVLETLALTATSFSASDGYVTYESHSMGIGEAVTFTGEVPDAVTAGTTYYVSPGATTAEMTPGQFKVSTDPDDLLGSEVSLSATGAGDCTLTRADGYFSFYISASRGGAELVAATDSGRWPAATSATAAMSVTTRGSLTGLRATCISGTADNVGLSRNLGDVFLDTGRAIVDCESNWEAKPQVGDKFTIDVPTQGTESVPFNKFALWLPWCPFEGRSPRIGPALIAITNTDGVAATVFFSGITAPPAGSLVRFYTSGTLATPIVPGRAYYVHTSTAVSVTLKETFASTTEILGDGGSTGTGNHSMIAEVQNGKVNPFPPAFNYPNHYGTPRLYQAFEGPSITTQQPSMGIAPGLGIKLHEYYGEQLDVAMCAVAGSSIGHKEVNSTTTGESGYGWLDPNQHKSWSPGEANGCFARFNDVLDSAVLAYAAEGNVGQCVGIVGLFGEEDSSLLALSDNYYRAAKRLKTAMREAVKLKFPSSLPAESLPFIHPKIATTAGAYADTVNASIQLLADEDAYARTYEVETFDLMADGITYTGASMSTASDLAYASLIDMDRAGYSKVQIANMALASLGDTGTITSLDPPDESLQASLCSQFWGLALNKALEHHNWDFSKRRDSPVAVTTDRTEWLYSYTLPVDYAGVISVLPEGATDDLHYQGNDIRMPYSVENDRNLVRRLYCNQENVILVYNARVKDPTQWSDSFVQFLSWALASMIAGPLFKGAAGIAAAQKALQMMALFGQQATAFDAQKTRRKPVEDNDAAWDRNSR